MFGLLVSKHALVGLYTFFNENSSKLVNFFHSYFTFVVITVVIAIQLAVTTDKITVSIWALLAVFFVDALFGFALLVKEYKYELLSGSLSGKYNYKIMKSTFRPTLTKEFMFNDSSKIQVI